LDGAQQFVLEIKIEALDKVIDAFILKMRE
jgi:hypothetical protein